MRRSDIEAVLFDLDGTLIDSAPDLAGAANDMRAARGEARLPFERLRPMAGSGARGMLGQAFDVGPGDAQFGALRDEFLTRYEARMTAETHPFADVRSVLAALRTLRLPWGIVTNKVARFAEPLVQSLKLGPDVLVCGDTTAHAKPHPEPLLEAARRLGLAPATCVYVGDDQRDVQAGRAAGMRTIAASWGYLGMGERIELWDADLVLQSPGDLLKWLAMP